MSYPFHDDTYEQVRRFYLYRHIRMDNNVPFYIGVGAIGKKDRDYYRAYTSKNRNVHWLRIISKTNYRVEILIDCLTMDEAKQKEQEFIKIHGRRDIGTGTLVNMTAGGDGVWGLKVSEETRKKICNAKKGTKLSEEHKEKIRSKMIGRIFSNETLIKMSAGCIGNKNGLGHKKSEDVRRRIAIASSLRTHTEETKKRISEASKGKKKVNFGNGHSLKLSVK